MKKIFLSSVLLSTLLPAQALPDPENIHDSVTLTAQTFHKKMRELVKKHGAENIVILSDLDGTLTHHSIPRQVFATEPRGHMPEILKHYQKKGVSLVIASAWNNMEEIIDRVHLIGLKENVSADKSRIEDFEGLSLPVLEEVKNAQDEEIEGRSFLNSSLALSMDEEDQKHLKNVVQQSTEAFHEARGQKKFHVVRSGQVVSVRDISTHGPFFRAKHHALDFLRKEDQHMGKKPVVVFLEDSPDTIGNFYRDMHSSNWYHSAQHVYAFHFQAISGNTHSDDIVGRFQKKRTILPPVIKNSVDEKDDSWDAGDLSE